MFKKFNEVLDTPITWRTSIKASLVSLGCVAVFYGCMWAKAEYDNKKAILEMRQEEIDRLLSENYDLQKRFAVLERG